VLPFSPNLVSTARCPQNGHGSSGSGGETSSLSGDFILNSSIASHKDASGLFDLSTVAQIATIDENQPHQTYADGRKILARRNVRDRPHRRCSTGPTQTPLVALLPSKGLKYVIPN